MTKVEEKKFIRKDLQAGGKSYFRPISVPIEWQKRLGWKDGESYRLKFDPAHKRVILEKVV